MIPVDANLLVYAHAASIEQHKQAVDWFNGQLNGSTAVGLAWPSLSPSSDLSRIPGSLPNQLRCRTPETDFRMVRLRSGLDSSARRAPR